MISRPDGCSAVPVAPASGTDLGPGTEFPRLQAPSLRAETSTRTQCPESALLEEEEGGEEAAMAARV
eukprot:CAMPEP_0196718084 /NCGR_PEP_ID=MMETSP1091-20130531/1376_1 /TAXON_ID=302021 /ORGANISM="Rhodomonas sp., Strain CCMP768" /LENGTH=66 /DNA_ID=CAMNT_0042058661 /DNA_START=50 /DNA_END=251 /DNA_ORIENTATION=-